MAKHILPVPKGMQWAVDLTTAIVTSRNRRAALKRQKTLIPALENSMAETRSAYEKAKSMNLTHMMSVYNVALYLLILHRDVEVIKLECVSTLENWKLKFYARQLAVAIFEAMDDLPHLLKRNRAALAAIDFSNAGFVQKQDTFAGIINRVKKQHERILKPIRDNIGAHRPQNAITFYDEVEAVDPIKVLKAAGDFYPVVEPLLNLYTDVMLKSDLKSIVKQFLDKP
jgi:hypothetical protein